MSGFGADFFLRGLVGFFLTFFLGVVALVGD
jgi:hypothetical protein